MNRNYEDGFLGAFADPGAVDDWGRIFTGRDEIRAWSDVEFIGAKGTLEVEEVSDGPDGFTVIGDWRSNHANGRSSFAFVLGDGGQVEKVTIGAAH